MCAAADLLLDPSKPLLSLPASLLITPEKAAASSSLQALLSHDSLTELSPEQLLVLFLVVHRRMGEKSPAFPYVDVLPSSFSTVEWWSEEETLQLCLRHRQEVGPSSTQFNAAATDTAEGGENNPVRFRRHRVAIIRDEWQQLNRLLLARHPQLSGCCDGEAASASGGIAGELPLSLRRSRLPPAEHALCSSSPPPLPSFRCLVSLAEYQWAYSCVATRSCYWPGPPSSCCLLPFLDLLNHSSFVTSTSSFDPSTRQYHLNVQHRYPSHTEHDQRPTIRAGQEVLISYGELSNWQLLTRYGFVLADSQDERAPLAVNDIEHFIARHCVRKRRGPRSSPSPTDASAASTAPLPAPSGMSTIRCCCTRTLLPRSLTSLPRSSAVIPPLPILPPWSKHHAALLALQGMYQIPPAFQMPCCHPHWPLLTYIRARTAFIGVDGCEGITTAELQRVAAALQEGDGEDGTEHAGWLDEEHQRRGRGLLVALARWLEGELGVEGSLEEEAEEVERLSNHMPMTESAEAGESGAVSWLSRLLSAQFRLSRRRLLLGFIQRHSGDREVMG